MLTQPFFPTAKSPKVCAPKQQVATCQFYAFPPATRKRRIVIRFSMQHPVLLPGMDSSSLRQVEKVVDVSIEPGNSMAVERAVEEHLKQMVLRHSEEFNGVPLSFSDMKILQKQEALVHPYFPFLQVRASAKFTVFSPMKGMKLVGVVKRVTKDMICLSVLDLFPVVLHKDAITTKLQGDRKVAQWVSAKDPSYIIEVGTTVVFTLESVTSKGGFFSINGSLKNLKKEGIHQKVVSRLAKGSGHHKRQFEDEQEINPRPKKRKKNSKDNPALEGGPSKAKEQVLKPGKKLENEATNKQKASKEEKLLTPKKKGRRKSVENAQTNSTKHENGEGKPMQSDKCAKEKSPSVKKSKATPLKRDKRESSEKHLNSGLEDVKKKKENGDGIEREDQKKKPKMSKETEVKRKRGEESEENGGEKKKKKKKRKIEKK